MFYISVALLLFLLATCQGLPAHKLPGADALSQARDSYEQALTATPNSAVAQAGEVDTSEQLALQDRAQGNMDEALADLLRARKFAPRNPRLLFDLGVLEDEMKLYHDADDTLAVLEQLPGEAPEVLYAVARVKLDLGQLAAAEEKMKAYLALRPDDASAHYGLGRIYRQAVQLDKARAEFLRSIALRPTQTEAYYQLADAALEQGDYAEALSNFARTLLGDPKHGGALTGSGIAYYRQKQYEKALPYLEQAINAAPEYGSGHYYLGLCLARMGRKADSDRELAIASKLAEQQNKETANRLRLNDPADSH